MFRVISSIESNWRWFNRESLTSEQLISWAYSMGIVCVEDRSNPYGSALYWHGERGVLYNPNLPEAEKVLVLGHEIGHHLLGHVYENSISGFLQSSLFTHSGAEKDASIVGYLCMIPSDAIFRLIDEERVGPEALYSEYRYLWADLDESYAFKICQARMRIFTALMSACDNRGDEGSRYLADTFGYANSR